MNLDDQQAAAVHTPAARAMVIAGAGSGKTRVLIERIGYLIEEKNVSPFEIMTFTFTRRAAGEIIDRLEKRVGPAAHHITAGTMHNIALNFLRRFGEFAGLKAESITIYNQWETDFLIQEVAADLGLYKNGSWKIPNHRIHFDREDTQEKNHGRIGVRVFNRESEPAAISR